MRDIETTEDVRLMVDTFYEKVKHDDVIGPIFTVAVHVIWERHLPVMYRFWENVLFFTGGYDGNPIVTHRKLHESVHLEEKYFERWTQLFTETVKEHFEGPKAKLAIQRAHSISTVMQLKLFMQPSQ
jgi:hemoglobin